MRGVEGLEHRRLRSAIEFAVAIADAGQKRRPPLPIPAGLRPYLKKDRIPATALGPLRRAVEADEGFRRRLAAGAVPELVDPIGLEWLRREVGWEDRVTALLTDAEEESRRLDAASALRRAERRREAAEQVAVRTRAELVALTARVAEQAEELDEARRAGRDSAATLQAVRADVIAARRAERHANDRAEAGHRRLQDVEHERDEARARATVAEAQRDALLADRAERAGATVPVARIGELRDVAARARTVADALRHLVDVPTVSRTPLAVPGALATDPVRATEHLLRSSALVLVDGYNVAKLAWPDLDLQAQRERCLDAVDTIARRYGSEMAVIFDGADVVGRHAPTRRLARVRYSPTGVIADDVIRAEVAGQPPERPIVVVTNDQAVRRDVAAAGANVVTSDIFIAVALG